MSDPVIELLEEFGSVLKTEVPTGDELDYELLMLVVESAAQQTVVNAVDHKVLQLSDIGELQQGHQLGVGDGLWLSGELTFSLVASSSKLIILSLRSCAGVNWM